MKPAVESVGDCGLVLAWAVSVVGFEPYAGSQAPVHYLSGNSLAHDIRL